MKKRKVEYEMETIIKNEKKPLELKDTLTELKNSREKFNKRHDHAEERISKLKDRSFEISQ